MRHALYLASLFPWDRQNESALGHRHLVLAYCFTWGIQLVYAAYVALKLRGLRKDSSDTRDDLGKP